PGWVRVFSEGIPATAIESAASSSTSPPPATSAAPQSDTAYRQLRTVRGQGLENDSASRELARYVREIALQYSASFAPVAVTRTGGTGGVRESTTRPFQPKLVFRPDRYLRGGDHIPFLQQGYAAVRLTEYREDFNHQHQNVRTDNGIEYGDLPKFVDFDYVANVARLNAATLASWSSAPAPPVHVRIETTKLENDSTLAWEPSPSGAVSRYEVLWRPTSASEWENFEPAGNVTHSTVSRSKDNVIFAVRALDRAGHPSLPVVPEPER
ncbi:MAG: M28 family metallopeptidase, partial [Burkholderiales bacterium]